MLWNSTDSDATTIPGGTSRNVIIASSNDSNGPPASFNNVDHTPGHNAPKIRDEVSSPDSARGMATILFAATAICGEDRVLISSSRIGIHGHPREQ